MSPWLIALSIQIPRVFRFVIQSNFCHQKTVKKIFLRFVRDEEYVIAMNLLFYLSTEGKNSVENFFLFEICQLLIGRQLSSPSLPDLEVFFQPQQYSIRSCYGL